MAPLVHDYWHQSAVDDGAAYLAHLALSIAATAQTQHQTNEGMLSSLDWIILCGTLGLIVTYGVWHTRKTSTMDTYLTGDRQSKWWTVGLGIMATQASAITFLSTPGQAYTDGLRFIQFYFGLPLAMVVLSVTAVPIFSRLKVFTAYQYLEDRFGVQTRLLASGIFLLQRGLSTGITIYAPSIVLSTVLGWDLNPTIFFIGLVVILYTVVGGNKAVAVTHQQQMLVIFGGLIAAVVVIINLLPEQLSFAEIMTLAGDHQKLNAVSYEWDLNSRYNIWSGIIGGFFLQLSYFGTDQSQVGRYLGGASVAESRLGLLMNGMLKIPMQLLILFIGVLVYVFHLFHPAPLHFNLQASEKVATTADAAHYQSLNQQLTEVQGRRTAILNNWHAEQAAELKPALEQLNKQEVELRKEASTVIGKHDQRTKGNDADYIFIHFVLHYLPHGLVGLLLAVILSAAMSSTSAALTSLSSTTSIDLYQRVFNQEASDKLMVQRTRLMTIGWGVACMGFALVASMIDNLIQAVNILGSLFYGCVLGIFLVGFYLPMIKGRAVFIAALLAEAVVIYCFLYVTGISYLWYNVIGALLVPIIGWGIEKAWPQDQASSIVK